MNRSFLVFAFGSIVTWTSAARAGDAALAESLFRQGRALMDANDYAAACPKLAESYSQDPATGTLLALALCQESLGATASAWASFSEVITRAKREGQNDREQAAREHKQALEAKLSHLTVIVPASQVVPGLVVKRDGNVLGQAAWGASVPVDPGEHVVEAQAPGKRRWSATVRVGASSDSRSITIPSLAAESGGTGAASGGEPGATGGDTGGAGGGSPARTIGLVVGGVGLVALGVGTYFGLHAASLNEESKEDGHCDAANTCDPVGLAKREDAISASTAATISVVAGGVLAATGVTLFLVGGSKGSERTARIEAVPSLAPGAGTLLVRGRF